MSKKKIVAVVVTYNRKEDLINCLQSIFNQSQTVDALYIIDNKSTDGTPEYLVKKSIIQNLPILNSNKDEIYSETKHLENGNQLTLHYIRKFENDGGAGGFYKGMKLAHDSACDWLWLMDDDGVAEKNQLNNLITYSELHNLNYSNALVIDIDNKTKLAFGIKGYENVKEIKEKEIIENFVNPFNGTLISKQVMDEIGLIKKEMFIWGDEREYTSRVRANGFKTSTILAAKHFHPKVKGVTERVIPFIDKYKVLIKPDHFAHIFYRNLGYLDATYGNSKIILGTKLTYGFYFILRLKFKSFFKFFKYYNRGLKNNYS